MDIKLPAGTSSGVYVVGKAVGDFTVFDGKSAKGRPFSIVKGQVLAGTTFVNVAQNLEGDEKPLLLRDGEDCVARVIPGFKANGILNLDVKLSRPEVQGVKK